MNTRISKAGTGVPGGTTALECDDSMMLSEGQVAPWLDAAPVAPQVTSSQGDHSTRINITAVVASLIQSEGIEFVAGCERDQSQAGAMLALCYGWQRWAAEAQVRYALRTISNQVGLEKLKAYADREST